MILGIGSFTYGWSVGVEGHLPEKTMDELDLLNAAVLSGLSCVQLGDNLPVHLFSDERLAKLKDALTRTGIRIELGARSLTEENLAAYIRFARFLDSSLIRFVVDGPAYEPADQDVVAIIRNAIPVLEEYGIVLGIENHDRLSAEKLAGIIEACGCSCVGICLDSVNSLGAGEGFREVSRILVPYAVNVHIKDFTVRRLPHKMGFAVVGVPAGKGMTDVDSLMREISLHRRCRTAILEQWVPPERTIEETIKKEAAWALDSIAYLKSLPWFTTPQLKPVI